MSRKNKGKYTLVEALDILSEAILVLNYPDNGTGVAQDDDAPPGNILLTTKMKKIPYFNKLNKFNINWDYDDDDWNWGDFESARGQDDIQNYSNTLQSMKKLFPEKTWKNIWKHMHDVPDYIATKRFKDAKQDYRKGGKDQLGTDKEDHIELSTQKNKSQIKKTKLKNENNLTNRINNVII